MGSSCDYLCRPLVYCLCHTFELSPGDWYYDPSHPDEIRCIPEDVAPAQIEPCNAIDTYINAATGIKYKYNLFDGMRAVGFFKPHCIYVILGEIDGDITMPDATRMVGRWWSENPLFGR